MAKTRKTATKSRSAKKAAGGKKKSATAAKKAAGKTRAAAKKAKPTHLNLGPLKKQLMKHVDLLSKSRSADPRVQNAVASLRRLHADLNENCEPTMTIPLA